MSEFVVYTPRDTILDDLDTITATARSVRRQDSVGADSETDNTLNIPQYSDDFEVTSAGWSALRTTQYSDDFESISGAKRSYGKITRNSSRYSGELETIKTSIAETVPEETALSVDDIEEDTQLITSGRTSRITFQCPSEYDEDSVVPTSGRTSRLTWQYSEDPDHYDTERENAYMYATESLSTRIHGDLYSTSEFSDTLSDQHTWDDSSEVSEATSEATYLAENNFLTKALARLKKDPIQKSAPHVSQARPGREKDSEEDKAGIKSKRAFCKKLLERLHAKEYERPATQNPAIQSVKLQLLGLTPGDYVENHGISHHAINRLRLENTKARLEKIAKEHVHQPTKCRECRRVSEELARAEFLKAKLHRVTEKLIQDKVDMVPDLATTLVTEPVVLPGEIQKKFGSSNVQDILDKLAKNSVDNQFDDSSDVDTFPNAGKETLLEKLAQCCHVKRTTLRRGENSQKDKNIDIDDHLLRTADEVDKVKDGVRNEMERLHNLDTAEFWRIYFEKIKG